MKIGPEATLQYFAPEGDGSGAPAASPTPSTASASPAPSGPNPNVDLSSEADDTNFDIPEGDDLDTIVIPSSKPSAGAEPPRATPPAVAPASPVPSSATPPASNQTPAGQQPAPAPAGGQPGQPPAAPAAAQPAPAAAPAAPSSGPAAPQSFYDQLVGNREALEAHFRDNLFKVTDKDREEIETSVETFIPKLASRVLFEAIQSTQRQIQQFVPDLVMQGVQTFLAAKEKSEGAKKAFFDKWPKLVGHEDKIAPITRAYIAANPQSTFEQRIDAIGLIVSQQAGIPFQLPQAAPPAQPAQPRAPAFVPAGANGGAPPASVAAGGDNDDDSIWAGFTSPG